MANTFITPKQFTRSVMKAMRDTEKKHGLKRWALLRAWMNESPMFTHSKKAKKRGKKSTS